MRIYTSPYPALPFPDESLFTFLFQRSFGKYAPTLAAFIDAGTGQIVTRGELKNASLALAYGLRAEYVRMGGVPLRRGDAILLVSPNSIAFPVALMAGIAAGLCVSLASPAYTPRELAHQWSDSRALAVFVHPSLVPGVLKMFEMLDVDLTEARRRIIPMDWDVPHLKPTLNEYICMSDLVDKGSLPEEEKFPGEEVHTTTILCYSSGTTGKPKGVEITHSTMISAIVSSSGTWSPFRASNPKALGTVPFCHIFGAVQTIMAEFYRGVPIVVTQAFDPVNFCKYVETYGITNACIVPPICIVLLHHPAVAQYNLSSLEYLLSGAAPLSTTLLEALSARLRNCGAEVSIIQGYGLTESLGFQLPLNDWYRKAGSVGFLMPHLEARLITDEGNDADEGEPGELWLRGRPVFKGYLRNIEATKAAKTNDGWFKTGDVAMRDVEGYFAIVDRKKELIKYKGFQVAPAELEGILLEHPDIADVGVIGIYSEAQATELPRAYVVHAQNLGLHERVLFSRTVETWIKGRVARHKELRGGVVVVDAIPKSPSGKILRKLLREQAQSELGGSTSSAAVMAKL